MLREFAIEPEGLNDFKTFVHIVDMFGISVGRAISRFPKRWKAAVSAACRGNQLNSELELARIEVILRDPGFEKTKLLGFHRPAAMSPEGIPIEDWHDAALVAHRERPFHRILVKKRREPTEPVAEIQDVWHDPTLLEVPTWEAIPQDARALARLVAPIMSRAKWVAIIDPFFHPGKHRWGEFIEVMLGEAIDVRSRPARIVLHAREMTDPVAHDYLSPQDFQSACASLASRIPVGQSLEVVVWRSLDGGEEFHDRMILTDTAALMCGRGWAAARFGASFNVVNLQGSVAWNYWTAAFSPSSTAFQRIVGPFRIEGTKSW